MMLPHSLARRAEELVQLLISTPVDVEAQFDGLILLYYSQLLIGGDYPLRTLTYG
jgi:hypothetical protein